MVFCASCRESPYNTSHSISQHAGLISIFSASSQQEITTVTLRKRGQAVTVPVLARVLVVLQLAACVHTVASEVIGAEDFLLLLERGTFWTCKQGNCLNVQCLGVFFFLLKIHP